MNLKNGKKKDNRHAKILVPSDADAVHLCIAVESRFLDLTEAYFRIKGVQLLPPRELDADMFLWRQMAVRFKKGDYRNSMDELKALQRVAQWTVDENMKLRNQGEKPPIQWKEG